AAKAAALIALGRPRADIEREFLASGRAAADFSDYYRERVAALGAGPRADATGGGSAPDRSWTTAGGLAARARENSGKLMLVGLGLALFGGALLVQTRKRAGDGRED
ncbi:MAG: hypothetical protein HY079_03685, partial [Elusimicrobia bacterium]|nr:hypothetical protein [Elusimicrobiota bacterium]